MRVELSQFVDDVMRRWPATIRVFLNYRMRCVGCPIACFHTIEDACREQRSTECGSWRIFERQRQLAMSTTPRLDCGLPP